MCKYSIKVKYDRSIWYKVLDTKGEELWIQCTKIHYGCRLLQKCCIIVYLIRRFNGTWPSRFWRLFFNMLEIARLFLLRLVTLDVMSCVSSNDNNGGAKSNSKNIEAAILIEYWRVSLVILWKIITCINIMIRY